MVGLKIGAGQIRIDINIRAFEFSCFVMLISTELWHQVYLPWSKLVLQQLKMCVVTGLRWKRKGQEESHWILILFKVTGVGSMSEPVSMKLYNCLCGSPIHIINI